MAFTDPDDLTKDVIMYKALMTDLGNTLVTMVDFMQETYLEVFQHVGIHPDNLRFYKQFSGRSKNHIFEQILSGQAGLEEKVKECVALLSNVIVRKVESLTEVEGAAETLKTLQRMNIQVIIASGFPREVGDEILRKFSWSSYPSVFREDVVTFRPAPDPVLKGLELAGVPPARFLVVGDTPYDVQSAQAAGCHSAAVTTGAYTREDFSQYHPTYILGSITEVPQAIS
jgi:pyrophosphatase PpaX